MEHTPTVRTHKVGFGLDLLSELAFFSGLSWLFAGLALDWASLALGQVGFGFAGLALDWVSFGLGWLFAGLAFCWVGFLLG